MNCIELTAQVVERAALRYTPAGVPALDLRLSHASELAHAGAQRKVAFEIHASAFGDDARQLEKMEVGMTAVFKGFLGKQRNGRGVMLQIQGFVPSPPLTS